MSPHDSVPSGVSSLLCTLDYPTSHTVHKKSCCIGPGAGNRKTGKAGLPFLGGG